MAGFFAGSAIAGLGFGSGFQGGIRLVVPLAAAHERAGVVSLLYVVSYLGLGVPAVLVRGADSRFLSDQAFRAAAALRPDLPAVVVGGADHYVPEERPAEVAQIADPRLREALARLGAEVKRGR